MSDDAGRNGRWWKLMLATFVALATTAAAAATATYYWTRGAPQQTETQTGSAAESSEDEGASDSEQEPPSTTRDPTGDAPDRELYDLPDHGGRLVGDLDGDRVGLPRVDADYEVDIRGDLASVVVRQTFENPSDRTLDTVYEFPLYSEAAVYSMVMEVGDRRIEGEVERKEEAREQYEKAKRQGKKAALLAQDRPNLFTQRVANVEAGQEVEITLRYTHPVPKAEGSYRLTVPVAVPERYTPSDLSNNALVDGDPDDPGASPGGVEGRGGASGFDDIDLSAQLHGGMPVSKVASSTHRVRVARHSESDREIELAPTGDPTDRHFRLRYRLSGDETRLGAHSYWDNDARKGAFDLLIEPPAEVSADRVPDREMVFVVDRSGSMSGERFRAAKAFVRRALEHLRADDRVRVILFGSSPEPYSETPVRATPENIEKIDSWLASATVGGGTEMAKAVRTALKPPAPEDAMRLVTFVTDVKVSNEFQVVELVREHVDDARMFALGVGGDANRYLLQELARAGRGFSRQLQLGQQMEAFIDDSVRRLQNPVLTDISVEWGGLDPTGVTPRPIPDVFEGGAVRLHGRYDEPGTHTVEVHGELAGEPVSFEQTVVFADSSEDGQAVELAWARQRIEDHMHRLNTPEKLRETDVSDADLREEITQLGLDHDLSTQWTSFVAVRDDSQTAAQHGPSDLAPREQAPGSAPSHAPKRRRLKKRQDKQVGRNAIQGLGNLAPGNDGSSTGAGGLGLRGAGRGAGPGYGSSGGELAIRGSGENSKASGVAADLGDASAGPESDVALQEPNVEGDLEPEIVRKVVRQHRRELQYCYEQELDDDPSLAGELTVRFTIAADGDVVDAAIDASTLDHAAVETCASEKVRRWTFPEPTGDDPVTVELPVSISTE